MKVLRGGVHLLPRCGMGTPFGGVVVLGWLLLLSRVPTPL